MNSLNVPVLIEKRSGYVLGLVGSNGRSVLNENVPFEFTWDTRRSSV